MGGFQVIFIFIFIVILGQVIKYYAKNIRTFYLIHLAGLLVVVIWALVLTNNQSGGVNWPWWFFAVFYAVPIGISLLFGVIQEVIKNK